MGVRCFYLIFFLLIGVSLSLQRYQ